MSGLGRKGADRRILVGGLLLALVVCTGLGWLVLHALGGARVAQAERHRAVVERLFDEIEGELSALVAREEARSFLEYRFFYVPDGNAYQAGLVQSELAHMPEDPAILGWFQVDPGGVVSTPMLPRDNELALANSNGWAVQDEALQVRNQLAVLLKDIPGWSEPAQPDAPATTRRRPPPRPMPVPAPSSLFVQRGADKRADRQTQVISTGSVSLESFNPSPLQVEQLVERNNQRRDPEENVEVEVTPLSGLRRGDHLVLHRVVHAAARPAPVPEKALPEKTVAALSKRGTRKGPTTPEAQRSEPEEPGRASVPELKARQGLVLRLPALQARLEETVLAGSPLRPYLELGWDGRPVEERTYRYEHRFAEPFSSLSVTVALDEVPELVGNEEATVRLLAVVLLLTITAGGFALFRAVRTELEYARRRNDFVAAVSHELKTPLTTIRMYAEMLRDGMVPSPEKQRAYHHTITMESDRLGRLIANVLELARLERGGPQPAVLVGQVEPVVLEAVEVVRPHAQAQGFVIEVFAEEGLPPACIDQDALIQIVVNLVDNAVKFTGTGEKRIELHLTQRQGQVLLSVRDHGPGVPKAQLRKVFEPFWRGERELTRRTRGTGIGLALVRGLTQRMGGQVQARNHPDGGFLVIIQLRAA